MSGSAGLRMRQVQHDAAGPRPAVLGEQPALAGLGELHVSVRRPKAEEMRGLPRPTATKTRTFDLRATNAISFDDAQACLLIDVDSHCKIETRSFIGGAAMDHRARIVGVLLAAILLGTLQGCGSPPAVRAAEIRSTEAFTRDQIQRIAAQYRSILLRSGGTDVCEPRTEPDPGPPHQNWRRCYVTIEVTPYTSNGFEYCLARLPERIEFNDSDKKKLIVFELKPTVQGSGPYRFDDQVGIRLFTNAGGAVVKGKFGNGDNGSDTPSQFHVKNSHGVRGEALYLPVILQVNSNDEPLSVCAAADPKIVNN